MTLNRSALKIQIVQLKNWCFQERGSILKNYTISEANQRFEMSSILTLKFTRKTLHVKFDSIKKMHFNDSLWAALKN